LKSEEGGKERLIRGRKIRGQLASGEWREGGGGQVGRELLLHARSLPYTRTHAQTLRPITLQHSACVFRVITTNRAKVEEKEEGVVKIEETKQSL